MDRLVVTVLVWALLAATTTAFVVTEALKLERPPVGDVRADRVFSPTCSCPRETVRLSFRLRTDDTIDVAVVDAQGDVVRTLASDAEPGPRRVRFRWDGTGDTGAIVPDGAYRLQVRRGGEDRPVTFHRRFTVDTEPPSLELLEIEPRRMQPGEAVTIRLELGERARVRLHVDGRRAGRLGSARPGSTEFIWSGRLRRRELPPGEYSVTLSARDRAGNRSEPTRAVEVTVVAPPS